MGYVLVFKLKRVMRNYPFGLSLLARSLILILAALVMNFLIETIHSIVISGLSPLDAIEFFYYEAFQAFWLINKLFFLVNTFYTYAAYYRDK